MSTVAVVQVVYKLRQSEVDNVNVSRGWYARVWTSDREFPLSPFPSDVFGVMLPTVHGSAPCHVGASELQSQAWPCTIRWLIYRQTIQSDASDCSLHIHATHCLLTICLKLPQTPECFKQASLTTYINHKVHSYRIPHHPTTITSTPWPDGLVPATLPLMGR